MRFRISPKLTFLLGMTSYYENLNMLNRREYLAVTAVGLSTLMSKAQAAPADKVGRRIYVFTKPIQQLSFAETASYLAKWDVGGVEATVRSGGWFEPNEAEEKLPKMMEELRKVERAGVILTNDVNHADHQDVRRVLEPASKVGIRYMRMAYYKYDLSKKILPQLEDFAKQAKGLAEVCKALKMTALYQNHAGSNYVGGPLWDLMEVLRDIDPTHMSVALDIRHATIESTQAWQAGYARLRDNVGAIFAKDAIYVGGKVDDGPLGRSEKGKQLFDMINKDHPEVPISLHMEFLDHRKPELLTQRLDAISKDVATLRAWLNG